MKRHLSYIAVALAAPAFVLGSCKQVSVEEPEQTGYLYVSLDRDHSEDLVFKSAPADDMTFSLKVYDALDNLAASVEDYRDLETEPLRLNVGEYTVVATSAEASAVAAFDAPFYTGSAGIEVRPDEVTNTEIVCSLANVKVTAVFSDEIKSSFKTYSLEVTNGQGSLTFSPEEGTADKEGYFSHTGTISWTLSLENNQGQKYSVEETYSDVKPRQHYNLSFSLEEKDEFGAGGFVIVVDNSLNEKEYDCVLDFGDEDIPEVSADFEYTESEPIELNAGDNTSKVLTFSSADGFRHLQISYGPSEAALSVMSASVNTVDLVGASQEVIASLEAAGIKASPVEEGAKSAEVDITGYIASYPIGNTTVRTLAVDMNGAFRETVLDFVLRSPVDVEAVSADPWAMFATLAGKWFTENEPDGVSFQYRKAAESSWTDVEQSAISADALSRTYTAEIRGLEPATEYVFRAVSAEDKETKEVSFTTETAEVLHNMSFDNWYQNGSIWMPNLSADYQVWDSANPGSGKFNITPTTPENTDVAVAGDGKKAVKLESKKALIVLAAGNIYTGKFGNTDGLGAYLDWGVPFSSRPLALKGWYKYQPKAIDMVKSPYEDMKGQTDICQIQVLLTDWDKPFTVNTNTGSFVDFENDPHIIAYGKLEDNTTSSSYKDFTIELDYRDMTRTPKYIVITACASKYGDYFTGGVGSTLWVDEFEFVYDPDELSE